MSDEDDTEKIAVIGMSGRFPGADDVEALWRNLREGTKSIVPLTGEQLRSAGVSEELLSDPGYVKVAASPFGVDMFDAEFFGIAPDEAEIMDPQHRLFLECAWGSLEAAGYTAAERRDAIGVFAGCSFPMYLFHNLATRPDLVVAHGLERIALANDRDSLTAQVSHKLDLRGPSVTVQAFSATSLVAVHMARQSLLSYESDLALAGAATINVPHDVGYECREGSHVSPDGECRSFDAAANGGVIGSGVAVVVLKRLSEALNDGDHIHCVILGSAINSSGAMRADYTAPSSRGQTAVILEAMANAGVTADGVGYVEAHGMGTALGDAIELTALKTAFAGRARESRPCAIGSLKPNLGHLEAASGVTGLIKAALMLERETLVPQINFHTPHPLLNGSPFQVNLKERSWSRTDQPRRAGVSSFGIGGVNAHVVLGEPPLRPRGTPIGPHLLVVSAKTPAALEAATERLRVHLEDHPETELGDLAYTLQVGRRAFAHRRMLVASDSAEALRKLADPAATQSAVQAARDRTVVLLIPEGKLECAGPAEELYAGEPVFRDAFDQCAGVLCAPHGTAGPRALASWTDGETFTMAVRFALGRLLLGWRLPVSAIEGVGRGALIAACLADKLWLEDTLPELAASGRPVIDHTDRIRRLLHDDAHIVVEVGDGTLTRALRGLGAEPGARHIAVRVEHTHAAMDLLGRLWLAGLQPDWEAVHAGRSRCRIPLPTYPFARTRHWVERAGDFQN
jgi:acyl transferase domain-containing protein